MARLSGIADANRRIGEIAKLLLKAGILIAGFWAVARAVWQGDAYELFAFGAIAFAAEMVRVNLTLGSLTFPCSGAGLPVTLASMPLLGPSACVPAVLASLARLATTEDSQDRPIQLAFQTFRRPLSAFAGGLVYLAIANQSAASSVPISLPALAVAIAAFGVIEFTAEIWECISERRIPAAAALTVLAGLALAFCFHSSPRWLMALTGMAGVAAYVVSSIFTAKPVEVERQLELVSETEGPAEETIPLFMDPLTGLANDRYLYMFLQQEIGRSVRKSASLSLLLIDIDDFQLHNESVGEEASNVAMVAVARLLNSLTREYDMVARCSSDEFVVALPEAKASDARETAERMRKHIANHDFGPSLNLRVSIGVATYPEHGLTADNLMSSAHHALNRAKFSGKNRVVGCEEILGKLKYGT